MEQAVGWIEVDADALHAPGLEGPAASGGDVPAVPAPPAPSSTTVDLRTLQASDFAALVEGHVWGTARDADGRMVLTYSFAGAGASFLASDAFAATASAMAAADRATVRAVLDTIEAVAAVRFVEVADAGPQGSTLRYAYSSRPLDMGFAGYAFFPSAAAQAGDVWIGSTLATSDWDFYRADLVLHETLHALGLKHPFEGTRQLAAADNVIPNTVLSYSVLPGEGDGTLSRYPVEPMPLDVQALQALYGAAQHAQGDTTYRLADPAWQRGFHVIWDTGGADVLDARGVATGVHLDLGAGTRSDIGAVVYAAAVQRDGTMVSGAYHRTLAIAQGVTIEHATGTSFDDVLVGNAANNALVGGRGDDRLLGGAGDDWLAGGEGIDWLDGGAGIDTAYFTGTVGSYAFSADADHIYVRDLATGSIDTLTGIERAVFADFIFSPGLPPPVAPAGAPDFAG
ncbi:M10 family metallopeptidase [Ramlibacter albus]|uniref:M10 family metallopeptidase C-terminal domain-containing protein n=1 Tax=Ramlibacter albus TaxID=2079448 RepID=A0A923M426_9BURK|nr:M10 family metallopeptidase [Ramlibacter albus]MBC5763486.1 M10 family metallopeptidase C-terminal domain-containing protein [Ramlibacter albus]